MNPYQVMRDAQDQADAERNHLEEQEMAATKEELFRQTPKLNSALIKAQSELENPKFDATNPHFRSKFASLKAVREAVIPVFTSHGIAVLQDLQTIDGAAAVYTHLLHESGEEKTYGPFVVPKTKNDAQGLASASTYARRYHLQSVANIVGEEDDDGNAASESAFGNTANRTRTRNQVLKAAEAGEDENVRDLMTKLDNDQKAELWGTLSKPQRTLITESRERLKEEENAEVA